MDHVEEFHIVGIGASAGGLHALEEFFRKVPGDCPAAFVVIQHLSPDFDSLMDELLARHTKLPIHKVVDGIRIESGGIYLIPPRFDMTVADGVLHLSEHTLTKGLHLPINTFFESLANAAGPRAVGVILSGSGADGAQGIQHIHRAGGYVIVQQPESAEFDSMPSRALATGVADLQLRPEQMALSIMNHIHGIEEAEEDDEDEAPQQRDELSLVLDVLRDHYRVDFQAYKLTTLVRRLERRLMLCNVDSLEEYITLLRNDLQEVDALYRDFLVAVTHFFRDPEAFDILRNKGIIDELVSRADNIRGLRIWVPGCATGQEAYSLAMLIDSIMIRRGQHLPVKIFATDVHQHSLSIASAGYYEPKQLDKLPEEYARKYFQPVRNGFQINANIRQMIVFAPHDLTQDPPFTQIDLVSCRNVLIYFTESAQSRILENLHYSLKLNGYLLLGPSEHLGAIDKEFITINSRWRIFRKARNTQFRRYSTFASLARASSSYSAATTSNGGVGGKYAREWQQALLDKYVPVGFLVDSSLSLVYTFGDAGKFLEPPTGTSTLNLLRMVNHELGLSLRAAIFRAQKERKAVAYRGVNWLRHDDSATLTITARPILGDEDDHQYYMLELREEVGPEEEAEESHLYNASGQSIEQVQALEQELTYTKEHLQMTIEELETTNEELQSANEELIASNEELQSTNEELHSVNEELYTVNAEYQRKIDELVQVTNDMQVLQEHAHITEHEVTGILLCGVDVTELKALRSELSELRVELQEMVSELSEVKKQIADVPVGIPESAQERISELVQRNEQLAEAKHTLERENHELARSNAELDSFVHIASHDLREPLRNIAQYARFLEEDHHETLDGDGLEMLDSIRLQSDHLASLLDDLRTYSIINRTQSGTRLTDLNELVQTVLDQLASLIAESGVIVQIQGKLPTIRCSASHLSTVFQNLIANAIKYNDKSDKHIEIRCETQGEDEVFCVSDNGIGIDERYTERIFEMFRRLHGQNEFGGGTGAGLAIVKKCIESTGGRIWLESEVGVGTKFYFTIGQPEE